MEIVSVFTVTERNGKAWTEFMLGDGQEAIGNIRKKYPRLTKFVLEGFEIEGVFIPLDVYTLNYIR